MEQNKLYWYCQISGWSIMLLVNLSILFFQDKSLLHSLTLTILMILAVGVSHVYRIQIKRRKWTYLPLKSLSLRVTGSVILMAVVLTTAAMSTRIYLPGNEELPLPVETGIIFFNFSSILVMWSLFYFVFHYFWDFKKAEVEKWQLEAKVKEAELQALKSQINPHFLFNMLNSIRALITEDPERAQRVVTRVARILRTSLQSGEETLISLNRELETVRDYLELESIRLEERLSYLIETDPDTMNIPVPAMLVQTLVENGVKHGLATLPEGGQIHIEAWKKGSNLQISVVNHGQISNSQTGTGIGLKNTRERLKLHYGVEGTLSLANSSPHQVTAQVNIPLELAG